MTITSVFKTVFITIASNTDWSPFSHVFLFQRDKSGSGIFSMVQTEPYIHAVALVEVQLSCQSVADGTLLEQEATPLFIYLFIG